MIDRNSIRRALAPLHASEDTIEEVLKMARHENTKRRYYPARRIIAVAAVIAVMVAALCGVGYAANWFGIQDVLLGHMVVAKGWDEDGNYGFMEKELETISMQGLSDSPEHMAFQEYKTFYDDYMLNDWEMDEPGVPDEETRAYQDVYSNVFNNTLSAKLREICEKYGLKTRSMMYESADLEQLTDILGVKGILEGAGYPEFTVYNVYDDGSVQLQTEWYPEGDTKNSDDLCAVLLRRSVKGYFSDGAFTFEAEDIPVEWSYTTARGDELSMVLAGSRGYVMHDGEGAFVIAQLSDASGVDLAAEELERFADTIYFGELGEVCTVNWPTEPSDLVYEPEVVYDPTPKEFEAYAVGESFIAEVANAAGGTMEYTVNSVQLVSNLTDVGLTAEEVLESAEAVSIFGGEGIEDAMAEDVIAADGTLSETVRFLLVDLTVKNIDAYRDIDGWVNGPAEHEYILRADGIYLEDTKVYDGNEGVSFGMTDTGCSQCSWFSERNGRSESWAAIEILPGESVTYQLGFLVGNAEDNYDGLYLATYGVDPAVVKLDLE